MQIDRYIKPPATAPRGPLQHPVLALGFRPFFLLAALFAVLWLPLWLLVYTQVVTLPLGEGAMTWHAHEMVFGFAVAVVAGFLLTAVRNWTRQPVPSGASLAALVALWLAGRVVMLFGASLPSALVATIDIAFLPALAIAVARPIIAARNRRNAGLPVLLMGLAGLNVAYHTATGVIPHRMTLVGVDLLILLLVLMGGRVIPFFTRNALPEARVKSHPWLDWGAFGTTAAFAVAHITAASPELTAVTALVAGAANLARVFGWDPLATRRHPILWVLHLGYLWIGVGLVLTGLGWWIPAMAPGAVHALTVGAIGTLILGMITRVSLGHTGRPLNVHRAIVAAYVLLTASALVRVVAPMLLPLEFYRATLIVSGSCFSLAFALFAIVYWPILTRPRADGAPG